MLQDDGQVIDNELVGVKETGKTSVEIADDWHCAQTTLFAGAPKLAQHSLFSRTFRTQIKLAGAHRVVKVIGVLDKGWYMYLSFLASIYHTY